MHPDPRQLVLIGQPVPVEGLVLMPDDRQVERPLLCPNAPERSITIATKAVHLRIFIYLLFDMKNRGFTLYLAYP